MNEFVEGFVVEALVEFMCPKNDRDRRVLRLYVEGLVCGALDMGVA